MTTNASKGKVKLVNSYLLKTVQFGKQVIKSYKEPHPFDLVISPVENYPQEVIKMEETLCSQNVLIATLFKIGKNWEQF